MGVLWQTLKDVKKPRVAILGAGLSGKAVLDYLSQAIAPVLSDLRVSLRDEKDRPCPDWAKNRPWVEWRCGKNWLFDLSETILFRSPGIRPDLPELTRATKAGAVMTSEIALLCRNCPARIYAVTGSDGKTTTSAMTHAVLQAACDGTHRVYLGGNIGRSLLCDLPHMTACDRVVLELSSFQLCDFYPHTRAAAVLNLTENHLNWHTSMEEYRQAKAHILPHAKRRVLSADDPATLSMAQPGDCLFSTEMPPDALWQQYGRRPLVCLCEGTVCLCENGETTPVFAAKDLPLPGVHHLRDAMAAMGLLWGDVSPETMRAGLLSFHGVPHRMQKVATVGGVVCVDSSIDTTPARTAATLAATPGRPTVICGGSDKGVSYLPLARVLIARAGCVVLTGQTRDAIRRALTEEHCPPELPVVVCEDFEEAVRVAFSLTPPGETLLLSPACASFDRFEDYRARSRLFCETVRRLP